MTEMERGHFANDLRVVSGAKHADAEIALVKEFEQYMDITEGLLSQTREANTGHGLKSWLDIGCGAGLLLRMAISRDYVAEGIELTADRRKIASGSTGAVIHDQPLEELDLDDSSFDVVSLINVFSHLTAPSSTLREIRRILKPDGLLLVATGEIGGEVRKSHVLRWNLGDHLYFLGTATMSRYAETCGLRIIASRRQWLPDQLLSSSYLSTRGRSQTRNAAKKLIAASSSLRWALLRLQHANPVYSSLLVLKRSDSSLDSPGEQGIDRGIV